MRYGVYDLFSYKKQLLYEAVSFCKNLRTSKGLEVLIFESFHAKCDIAVLLKLKADINCHLNNDYIQM